MGRRQITIRNDRRGQLFQGLERLCEQERKRHPDRVTSRETLARELILDGLRRRRVIQLDSQ